MYMCVSGGKRYNFSAYFAYVKKIFLLMSYMVKGCVRHIFVSFFKSKKRAFVKLRKMFVISLQMLFSFSRKSKFRILDIQILWRHQMPKHKTRNTFY